MATPHAKLLTVEDLAQLVDDEWRYDLIEGELFRMPPTGGDHGTLGGRLFLRLGNYIEQHTLGQIYLAETGFIVQRDPDVVLGPDIAFVRAERVPPRTSGYVPLTPDLAVEIRSRSESQEHVERKSRLYLAGGALQLWYVDPRHQTVTVYRPLHEPTVLGIGAELDGADVLPGFRLPIADVFG